jgi:hypothetical protein
MINLLMVVYDFIGSRSNDCYYSKIGRKQNLDGVICDILAGCLRQILNVSVLEYWKQAKSKGKFLFP